MSTTLAPSFLSSNTAVSTSPTTTDIEAFPAFYTLQPNPSTRASQLAYWSSLLLSHYQKQHTFSLTITPQTLTAPPFANPAIRRSLGASDARTILNWMASKEGGERIEWIAEKGVEKGREGRAWVYWRRPEEWAALLVEWVEATGQKGGVFTVFELVEGEGMRGNEWYGMDTELLKRCLNLLVKQGKAQIFGSEDSLGVKFL
jgi:ESCRT-II complex subunit VPS25